MRAEALMLWVILIAAFAVGLAAALFQVPPPGVMRPIIGGVLMLLGVFFGFSALRETWTDRAGRLRLACVAASMLLMGAAHILPEGAMRLAANAVALAIMLPACVLLLRDRRRRSRAA